ncbi:RNA polymerase ECF-subfamily sigma factor [Micromonospora sp. ATCC 39149]|uniref:SigE family RNA polymerase sigma factor n=1 Tax=Micromonospora sp. (strain ATCC 39149 / NRRL 15099 / SCC 1413) TaxID=219305 RepID=UPI0001A50994|nr:SigE family RNA polymerase sigma factor [Micromonospora sp. ATCC 39149]EEP73164.1 RNA polymerase ECF-subfamily sigma factor [Micromonospora sp. ATCC 39149]
MAAKDPLEEEFREFVAARSGALLRTAYLLTGDWATAEDLLQTALTKTYLACRRLGGIEAIEPYARRVMVNTSTSWWRRRWHGERPTEVLPERAAVDEIEQQLDRDVLWRQLRALPSRQRAVLVLRFYEDMSEAQTAALLEISPGTVKSQTSRALATLRRRLGDQAALGLADGRAQTRPEGRVEERPEGRAGNPSAGRARTRAGDVPRHPDRRAAAPRPASAAMPDVPRPGRTAATDTPAPSGSGPRPAPATPRRPAPAVGGPPAGDTPLVVPAEAVGAERR